MSEPVVFAPAGSVPIALRSVEEELRRQMKARQGADDAPIHIARMSNLVIFCDQRQQAENLAAEIPQVVAVHPARVLLVVGEAGAEASNVTAAALIRALQSKSHLHACSEM